MSTKVCSSCLKLIDSVKFQSHLLSECAVRYPNKNKCLLLINFNQKKVKEASLVTAYKEVEQKPICPHCSEILKDEKRLAIHLSSKCPKSPDVIKKKKQQAKKEPASSSTVARNDVDSLTAVSRV
ncbi:hypothetical protein FLM48_02425 [Shewanella sp. Scap07]|uniref:hypothetical protein n=1 Tax=Shewanella sp. Scap07 TaxID=2589987 RepID=UPI0015BF3A85|nr:hypothetical protein [Shewanella sp. Scap07]QLE84038.1 hypothetical protein FLM48_02425 [Shewanella sp. Scap07]